MIIITIITILIINVKTRSSSLKVFFKKAALETFANFTRKYVRRNLFPDRNVVIQLEKETPLQIFSSFLRLKAQIRNICRRQISRNIEQCCVFLSSYRLSKRGGTRRFPWRNWNDENNRLSQKYCEFSWLQHKVWTIVFSSGVYVLRRLAELPATKKK